MNDASGVGTLIGLIAFAAIVVILVLGWWMAKESK